MKKHFFRSVLSFVLILALLSSLLGTYAETKSDVSKEKKWLTFSELVAEKGFVNGVQQGWFIQSSPGNDIGHTVRDGYTHCQYKDELFMKVLYDCKAMGYDIFKTWLNYNFDGMRYDKDYRVVGIDADYLVNLEKIIKMAKDAGLYLCFSTFNHCEGTMSDDVSSYKYERMIQYIYNEDARNMVFKNWLLPILNLVSKYDNVVLIDLYTEPEADGGEWGLPNGTSWKVMREFLKAQNDFIKEHNPRLETYVSSTLSPDTQTEKFYNYYSGLGLDYYGRDEYNDCGAVTDTAEVFLDAPLIYGEVGIDHTNQKGTDDYVSNCMSKYYQNAVNNGLKAGFWWCYGFPSTNNKMSLVDSKYRPRSATVTSRFWQLDREYALAGLEDVDMDKPAVAYSTNESIIWMGSRGAQMYRLERRYDDGDTWTKILDFDAEKNNSYEYSTLMYEAKDLTAEPGNKYRYRVVAISPQGVEVASDDSNVVDCKQVICSDEENLIKNHSFEIEGDAGFSSSPTPEIGKWYKLSQSQTNELTMMKYITNGTEGEETHSGTHSIYKPKRLYQVVNLKPNTDYTYTFFVKFVNIKTRTEGEWDVFYGIVKNTPSNDEWDIFEKGADKQFLYPSYFDDQKFNKEVKDGDWHRFTYFFNSGEADPGKDTIKVKIAFTGTYVTKEENRNLDWYLDDFYLFETK